MTSYFWFLFIVFCRNSLLHILRCGLTALLSTLMWYFNYQPNCSCMNTTTVFNQICYFMITLIRNKQKEVKNSEIQPNQGSHSLALLSSIYPISVSQGLLPIPMVDKFITKGIIIAASCWCEIETFLLYFKIMINDIWRPPALHRDSLVAHFASCGYSYDGKLIDTCGYSFDGKLQWVLSFDKELPGSKEYVWC